MSPHTFNREKENPRSVTLCPCGPRLEHSHLSERGELWSGVLLFLMDHYAALLSFCDNKPSGMRNGRISFFSSTNANQRRSEQPRKPGNEKVTTFLYCWAEKKRIITLQWRWLWGDKHGRLREGRQTKTDLLYLLKQRHAWEGWFKKSRDNWDLSLMSNPFFHWPDIKGQIHKILTIHTIKNSFYLPRSCVSTFCINLTLGNTTVVKLFAVWIRHTVSKTVICCWFQRKGDLLQGCRDSQRAWWWQCFTVELSVVHLFILY